MTSTQLKNYGIPMNTWISLYGVCNNMLMSNEGYLIPTEKTYQYYFDDSDDLVFIRHTRGDLSEEPKGGKVPVNIVKNGESKLYYTTICNGGVSDKIVGRYHEVFAMQEITSVN